MHASMLTFEAATFVNFLPFQLRYSLQRFHIIIFLNFIYIDAHGVAFESDTGAGHGCPVLSMAF